MTSESQRTLNLRSDGVKAWLTKTISIDAQQGLNALMLQSTKSTDLVEKQPIIAPLYSQSRSETYSQFPFSFLNKFVSRLDSLYILTISNIYDMI